MIQSYPREEWKEIEIEKTLMFRYAISNFGRLASFKEEVKDGNLLAGGTLEGYKIFRFRVRIDDKLKNRHLFFHKLVAQYFLPKNEEDNLFVLHLDFDKKHNIASNLKWATRKELFEHHKSNPLVVEAREKFVESNIRKRYTLNAAKVEFIKKILLDPNRKTRMKVLAKQFGVSEMQLYRIKRGENWGQIKVS